MSVETGIYKLPESQYQVEPEQDVYKTEEKRGKKQERNAKIKRIAWDIFSVIIFPVGIARLIGRLIRRFTPDKLLPAAEKFNLTKWELKSKDKPELATKLEGLRELHADREQFIEEMNNHSTQATIRTADGVNLDTLMIEHTNQCLLPVKEQKWIVYLPDKSNCFEESLEVLKVIRDRTGANIYTGNFRGVMRSEGKATSFHKLALDGEAMIQYLLQKGVPAENILVHGNGSGATVATEIVSHHQEKEHEMHLCSEDAYASSNEAIQNILPAGLRGLDRVVSKSANWKFDSIADYRNIKGQKFIIYSKTNGSVSYHDSLYRNLKKAQMSDQDRQLKNLRDRAKELGCPLVETEDSTYKRTYKPTDVIKIESEIQEDDPEKESPKTRYILTQSGTYFDQYVKQVQKILKCSEVIKPPSSKQSVADLFMRAYLRKY